MTLPSDILYNQALEVAGHLAERKVTLPTGSSLADYCRLRSRASTKGGADYIIDYEDGSVINRFSLAPSKVSQETLDMSLGKDPNGRWIGGPFASHKIEWTRRPTSWYQGNVVEYPEFLQPPATSQHTERKFASFLFAPSAKPGRFFNPASNPSAHPQCIAVAIQQALGRLQGARNSARPDSTYADFAVSIAELREVSSLVSSRAKSLASALGSGYLAYAFGWTPLISDASKLANMASATKKRIEFLRANNGKPVRRKRTLYEFTSDLGELYSLSYGKPFPFNTIEFAEASSKVHGVLSCKAEYHSVLRYALPKSADSLGWDDEAFKYLVGLRPGLDLFWELAPWTWLVDWFTNVGDFVGDQFGSKLVDTTILDEWITIKCELTSWATLPTVAGGLSSYRAHTSAYTERKDTFKYRMIPPDTAPLQLLDLIPFSSKQQAILAALAASRQRYL